MPLSESFLQQRAKVLGKSAGSSTSVPMSSGSGITTSFQQNRQAVLSSPGKVAVKKTTVVKPAVGKPIIAAVQPKKPTPSPSFVDGVLKLANDVKLRLVPAKQEKPTITTESTNPQVKPVAQKPIQIDPQQKKLSPTQLGQMFSTHSNDSAKVKNTPEALAKQGAQIKKVGKITSGIEGTVKSFISQLKQGESELGRGIVPNKNQLMPRKEYGSEAEYQKALKVSQQEAQGKFEPSSEFNRLMSFALTKPIDTVSFGLIKSEIQPKNKMEQIYSAVTSYGILLKVPFKVLVKFTAVSLAFDTVFKKITNKQSVSDLLPEDAPGYEKFGVDVLEFLGKAYLTHSIKPGALRDAFTKQTLESHGLPETYFFSPSEVESVAKGQGSAIAKDVLARSGMSSSEWRAAVKSGAKIEIPAEKVIQITDKPYWRKIKGVFGASATNETTVSSDKAKVTGIAGLLGDGEKTPQEVINTVMRAGIEKTEDGHALLLAAMEAQKQGKNIHISTQKVLTTKNAREAQGMFTDYMQSLKESSPEEYHKDVVALADDTIKNAGNDRETLSGLRTSLNKEMYSMMGITDENYKVSYRELQIAKEQDPVNGQILQSMEDKIHEIDDILEKKQTEAEMDSKLVKTEVKAPDSYISSGEEKAFSRLVENKDKMISEYVDKFGTVVNSDNAKEMFASEGYTGKNVKEFHRPAVQLANAVFEDLLSKKRGEEPNKVYFTVGGTGSGKTSIVNDLKDKKAFSIALDSTGVSTEYLRRDIKRSLEQGYSVTLNYVYRDILDAYENGVLMRERHVPESTHLDTHTKARDSFLELYSEYKGNPRVNFVAYQNETGKAPVTINLDTVKNLEYNKEELTKQIHEATDRHISAKDREALTEERVRQIEQERGRSTSEGSANSNQQEPAKNELKTLNTEAKTPVGEGKSTPSKAYTRIVDRLTEETQLDVNYNKLNLKEDAQKALDFVTNDPKAAVRVSLGLEKPPEGQTETAISIATADKAYRDGDFALASHLEGARSLRQTRRGQEIVSERGRFNENSPHTYIRELMDRRLKTLGSSVSQALKETAIKGKSAKEAAIERIDRETAKLKEKIRKDHKKIILAQDFIDSLRC